MTGQDENLRPVGYDEPVHQPFDVQAQRGQYAMWKLLGAIAFLIILALLVFFVYQPGARDREDPVIISPNKTALKVPPLDSPKNTVNDKAIYQAGKSGSTPTVTATIDPEAPIQRPKTVDIIETPKQTQPITTPPVQQAPKPVQVQPVKPQVQTQTPQYGTNGTHLVQVASLRSYEEAEAAWNKITRTFTFLRGQPYDIKRVDLNEKGVYYRLRIDGLSNSNAAAAVCQKLKAGGQACFKTSR